MLCNFYNRWKISYTKCRSAQLQVLPSIKRRETLISYLACPKSSKIIKEKEIWKTILDVSCSITS